MKVEELNVLVVDDDQPRAERWKRTLAGHGLSDEKIKVVGTPEEAKKYFGSLKKIHRDLRLDEPVDSDPPGELQHFDVLVADFDLAEFDVVSTGALLCHWFSAFTNVSALVKVNELMDNNTNYFDLRLTEHRESNADVDIGGEHLKRGGLWHQSTDEFRPWHWPLLPTYCDCQKARLHEINGSLDRPIAELMGLNMDALGLAAKDAIAVGGSKSDAELTARDVAPMAFFSRAERERALRGEVPDILLERLICRFLGNWAFKYILQEQSYLCDLPHLFMRLPGAFQYEDLSELHRKIVDLEAPDPKALLHEDLHEFLYSKQHWICRPAVDWYAISREPDLLARFSKPRDDKHSEYVFLEDYSRFAPVDKAQDFSADLEAVDNVRYVATKDDRCPAIDYTPKARFAR